jgi:hypothetical protein
MIALGNLHLNDRVLVCFFVAGFPVMPNDPPSLEPPAVLYSTKAREVWKERRVLGIDYDKRTVRVLDYHLEPIDVSYDWLREVPAE